MQFALPVGDKIHSSLATAVPGKVVGAPPGSLLCSSGDCVPEEGGRNSAAVIPGAGVCSQWQPGHPPQDRIFQLTGSRVISHHF